MCALGPDRVWSDKAYEVTKTYYGCAWNKRDHSKRRTGNGAIVSRRAVIGHLDETGQVVMYLWQVRYVSIYTERHGQSVGFV